MTGPAVSRSNSYIGASLLRREDLRLLRGSGEFVGDLARPGMLHAAIFRSSYAYGEIRRLDANRARRAPGVHAIISAADIGPQIPTIPLRQEALDELKRFEQPVIAHTMVRYVGEPVAVVLATSRALAEDALEFIDFEVDVCEPFLGVPSGYHSNGSPHLDFVDHTAMTVRGVLGDASEAFRRAHYVRREKFKVQRHSAVPMETRGLLAEPHSSNRISVFGAAKVPFSVRTVLAKQLGIPVENISMVENDVGGGFGVRGEFYPEDFLIAFAARLTGRPVKWIEDRREHFLATNHAREMDCELAIACDANGKVVGLQGDAWCDLGAYLRTNAITQPRNVAQVISGPYSVPNIEMTARLLMTNKTPAGTYRGPGRFEADFFRERLFDLAASDLNLDRVEFRRRNIISSDQMPYKLPKIFPYNSETECDSGDYSATFIRCLNEIGWDDKKKNQGQLVNGRYYGLGLGCYIESGASGPKENVRLSLEEDGTFTVYTGSSGVGQGLETIMAQIAADALAVPIDRINTVRHGSTDYLQEGFGTYGSRSVVMGGSAIVAAAKNLHDLLRQGAALRFKCSPDQVQIAGEVIQVPGASPVPIRDFAHREISGQGSYSSDKRTYSYGTHAAYVAVDPETGRIEVLEYVAVEDIGRAINPDTLRGQTLGAIVQGLGGALLESFEYDADGQSLTGSFADYLLPSATDFPTIRTVTLELCPSPHNPLGAKGGGEGGIIPVGGVISNAVAAALAHFQANPLELPISPWMVWRFAHSKLQISDRESSGASDL